MLNIRRNFFNTLLFRRFFSILLLGILWGGIAKWNTNSWLVGVPSILIAFIVFEHLRGQQQSGIRLWLLPQFAAWFFWQSLRGGVDVSWRTLQPKVPLFPGFLRYQLNLPPGPSRIFMANCISLLPGSLCVDIIEDELMLHVLNTEADVILETRNAEFQVEKLYGIFKEAEYV